MRRPTEIRGCLQNLSVDGLLPPGRLPARGKGSNRRLVPADASVRRSGVVFRWFSLLDLERLSRHAGTMPRAMRVEYPGAIYHVMDRGDRREDILIIGTAKGAKSVLHRSGRGQHQHKPARADEPCAQLEFQSTV
jgi:hypothetical protein